MYSRRKALQLVGTTVTLGGVSGCLGVFQDGGIRIKINNGDDQQHTVNVTFEKEDETVFSDEYTVSAGERTTTSDVVKAGEYLVTVELNPSTTKTMNFNMGGCPSNTLSISISENSELWAKVLSKC